MQATNIRRVLSLGILCLAPYSRQIFCQTQQAPQESAIQKVLSSWIILPWKTFNIPREIHDLHKEDFIKARDMLSRRFIQNPGPLSDSSEEALSPDRLPRNLERQLRTLIIGKPLTTIPLKVAATIQPVLCSLGDQVLTFLAISHSSREILIGAGHHLTSWQELQKALRQKQPGIILRESLKIAADRAQSQIRDESGNDALKISLRSGGEITPYTQPSAECLNLLIAEKLLKQQYTVLYDHGREYMTAIRNYLGITQQPERSTRILNLAWSFPPESGNSPLRFPIKPRVRIRLAESVFAYTIRQLGEKAWEFRKAASGEVLSDSGEDLFRMLEQEKKNLIYKQYPTIVKTDRGWVYTDRGRAWGLRMKDRMIVQGSNGRIKGHVVRFFGPELQLKNQAGEIISEGAILFIRKGQKQVRVGQVLDYDQTSYPTPWPPARSAP